ncbi:unnamed protein product, partial [Scytosiphon promiscuus]
HVRCHRDVVEQAQQPGNLQMCKFSVENDMVPRPPPPELQGLTISEEMMISTAFPVCKVVRLAGGSQGYESSVISIGQGIGSFATSLPWLADAGEMPALAELYREDNEEVDIMHLLHTVREAASPGDDPGEEEEEEKEEGGGDGPAPCDYRGTERMPNPLDDGLDPQGAADGGSGRQRRGPRETFIPTPGVRARTEEESLQAVLEEMAGYREAGGDGPATMPYPRREGPVREDTPWLASMFYPTLFPRGVADPFVSGRRRDVSLVNCITHLVKFVDRPEGQAPFHRFASHRTSSHRTFRYWALDIRLRNQAKSQCRTFLRHNSTLAELDPSEVTEDVIGQLMRVTTRYLANISGTDGFWLKWQGKLGDAVDQLESLTTFTTYSAADHHHPDLYRLMPGFGPELPASVGDGNLLPIQERNRLLIANPHIADWWRIKDVLS